MGIIKADELGQDYEDRPADEGEYELRIAKAEYKANKAETGHLIALMLTVEGQEGVSPINHWLSEPKDDDKPTSRRFKMREIKRFAQAFGIDISDGFPYFDENEAPHLAGSTAKVFLKKEETQDADGNKTGEFRNVMRLPKVD